MTLYDSDFYAWVQEQAKLLRSRQWELLDLENLIDEVESLGRWEQRQLEQLLAQLMAKFLHCKFSQDQSREFFISHIRELRRNINLLTSESPSLSENLTKLLPEAYQSGIDLAVGETNLAFETFPPNCPYTLDYLLNSNEFLDRV